MRSCEAVYATAQRQKDFSSIDEVSLPGLDAQHHLFRDLGGFIRIAGDIAMQEGAPLIAAAHIRMAMRWCLPTEEQMALPQALYGVRQINHVAR